MPSIDDVKHYLSTDTGLAVISTTQADGRVLSSLVNFGVIDHPVTGEPRVAMVSGGSAARLGHVRRGSEVTVAVTRGWNWVGVTGPAELIGPADDGPLEADAIRLLLREIYTAAGGTHDDFDEFDREMVKDGRTAVLVEPSRIIGNSPQADLPRIDESASLM